MASTSARASAGSGRAKEVTTTHVPPVATTGATTLLSPSSDDPCGASTATTPVGSGTDRLKYGPATGFGLPATWATLSVQPAYQTHRSTLSSTCCRAVAALTPSASATSSASCAARPSSISATRYSTCPRLYAVAPDQPARAARAATTASRASLRDARAALARTRPSAPETT